MELALAPLQTFTDFHFRNAFQQVFKGVDYFYAPYLKLNNDGTIKENTKVDVLPKNNPFGLPVPQLMACSPKEFFVMENYLDSLGYTEVNWNMGCPYPMVTNKNWGAGILNKPDDLLRNLEEIYSKLKLDLSIKMRMGLESTAEILHILPILNEFPLTEVIIHGRYAKQLYSGEPDKERFAECIQLSKHSLCYNGDVDSIEEFETITQLFPNINKLMIGRGALKKPWLFEEIRSGKASHIESRMIHLSELIYESCTANNPSKGYALQKLKSYWEYFSEGFEDGKHMYRKLKKTETAQSFLTILHEQIEIIL